MKVMMNILFAAAAVAKEVFKKIRELLAPGSTAFWTVVASIGAPWSTKPLSSGLLTSFLECLRLFPIGSVLVILLPLLRIGQDFLRLIELFKFLFHLGLLCPRMEIGMILAGEFPERFADFVVGGAF